MRCGQSACILLQENAIIVSEAITTDETVYAQTEGARAHDYLQGYPGGAIGGGLPLALGVSVACPDGKTVVFEGDGCGMYTVQALWSMAREQADITIVVMNNDIYGILNIELARVRESDANDKMESMLRLDNPSIDWVKISEAQGVPATRATTAEQFHKQFEAAMSTKGPHLIEAHIIQNLEPMIDQVHDSRMP